MFREASLSQNRVGFGSAAWIMLVFFGLAPTPAPASTWVITADGAGDFPTLRQAIDVAASGDTILVGPGEYEGPFWIETKNLVLRSLEGPDATVLSNPPTPSSDTESVVHFFFEEHPGSTIEGFTIQHGKSGIRCSSASPTIRGNIIQDNSGNLGAGICVLFNSAPTIEENWIRRNAAIFDCCFPSRGAGIYADDTSPVIVRRNLIVYNRCVDQCIGGGISAFLGNIEENTIFGNFADGPAGGVELPGEGVTLSRNVIVGNRSKEFADGIMVQRTALLSCNDVWSNGTEDYWGCEPGEDDFSADPRFCGLPGFDASSSGRQQFDLRGDSPCLPGQHPNGADCGTIGAGAAGCGSEITPRIETGLLRRPTVSVTPNPMRARTRIRLAGGASPGTIIEIIGLSGRIVRRFETGNTEIVWDGRSAEGCVVAAGVYFVRVTESGSPPETATILMIR